MATGFQLTEKRKKITKDLNIGDYVKIEWQARRGWPFKNTVETEYGWLSSMNPQWLGITKEDIINTNPGMLPENTIFYDAIIKYEKIE